MDLGVKIKDGLDRKLNDLRSDQDNTQKRFSKIRSPLGKFDLYENDQISISSLKCCYYETMLRDVLCCSLNKEVDAHTMRYFTVSYCQSLT